MAPTVLKEQRGKVGILTLNRPEKLNTLNDDLLISLYDGVRELEEEDRVRVIVVRAAGRSFCAGFDLSPREKPFSTVSDWYEHARLGNRTFMALWDCKKPTIAAVHGFALGGGCDMAMVCDFTIAAESCMLGEPEIQFNSAPPFGNIMPNLIGMKKTRFDNRVFSCLLKRRHTGIGRPFSPLCLTRRPGGRLPVRRSGSFLLPHFGGSLIYPNLFPAQRKLFKRASLSRHLENPVIPTDAARSGAALR